MVIFQREHDDKPWDFWGFHILQTIPHMTGMFSKCKQSVTIAQTWMFHEDKICQELIYERFIMNVYIYININSQSIVWFYKVIYDIILTNSPSQPWPWQADLVERVNQVVEVCDGENWVVLLLKTLSSIRF